MSDKPSEYLKRTCLICGCHTNQTINIYEPRSGPNIVQLIQAKFKFQPLNEDKYLCFSCNNWLINWHSLQALNSNDAQSPSGTFRSHMNSMVSEKGAGSQHQQEPKQQQQSTTVLANSRPVAQVRPMQRVVAAVAPTLRATATTTPQISDAQQTSAVAVAASSVAKAPLNYSKRSFRTTARFSRQPLRKSLQTCCICGRSIVIRMTQVTVARKSANAKCRKCREVCAWRAIYLRSIAKLEKSNKTTITANATANLVNNNNAQANATTINSNSRQFSEAHNQSSRQTALPRPRVDGKVVSMLRRLGTTLSREQPESASDDIAQSEVRLPFIMSPVKEKPQWTRQLEEDEILLDFNSAISEVLPRLTAQQQQEEKATVENSRQPTRRRLTYQMTSTLLTQEPVIDLCDDEDDDNEAVDIDDMCEDMETDVATFPASKVTPYSCQSLESLYNLLPKGLSVSLI